eukprot:169831_1
MWYKGEPNPDYKLVVINSSNKGFVSRLGSKTGSLMIQKFTEKMDELHKDGKQLIEAKYNNKLEYGKFKKNVHGLLKSYAELQSKQDVNIVKVKQEQHYNDMLNEKIDMDTYYPL